MNSTTTTTTTTTTNTSTTATATTTTPPATANPPAAAPPSPPLTAEDDILLSTKTSIHNSSSPLLHHTPPHMSTSSFQPPPPPSQQQQPILDSSLSNAKITLDEKLPASQSDGEKEPFLRILVRTPTDALPDNFSIPVQEHSTIRDLKLFLENEHPGKPKCEDQKLIFCGKVLDEEARVMEVLKKCDLSVSQTFHLVVRRSSAENLNSIPRTGTRINSTPPLPDHIPSPTPSPYESFRMPHSSTNIETGSRTTTRSATEVVLNGIRYQHVRINGLPYLMSLPYPHYDPAPPAYLPPMAGEALPGVPMMGGRPPDPMQNAMRGGRAFGNGNENGVGQRSAIQLAIKIGILLLIFCRNASIERAILMHIVALVIFLHQAGRLRLVRGRVLPNGDIAIDRNERNINPLGAPGDAAPRNNNVANSSPISAIFQAAWAFFTSMVPSNEVVGE